MNKEQIVTLVENLAAFIINTANAANVNNTTSWPKKNCAVVKFTEIDDEVDYVIQIEGEQSDEKTCLIDFMIVQDAKVGEHPEILDNNVFKLTSLGRSDETVDNMYNYIETMTKAIVLPLEVMEE